MLRLPLTKTLIQFALLTLLCIFSVWTVRAEGPGIPPGDTLRAVLSMGDGEVRPFITDDSRVVGERLGQLETWCRADELDFQQWLIFAYGPNDRLEISAGGVLGVEYGSQEAPGVLFRMRCPCCKPSI